MCFCYKIICRRAHLCERVTAQGTQSSLLNTEKILDEFRDNMKMDLKNFAAKVQREYNMHPDRWKLGRARKVALKIIHGDEAAHFADVLAIIFRPQLTPKFELYDRHRCHDTTMVASLSNVAAIQTWTAHSSHTISVPVHSLQL